MFEKNSNDDFDTLLKVIALQNNRLGLIQEDIDDQYGDFVRNWINGIQGNGDISKEDLSEQVRKIFLTKNEFEILMIKKSAKFTTLVLQNFFRKQLETSIENEKTVSHSKFSDDLEKAIEEPEIFGLKKLNPADVGVLPPVLITSGSDVHFNDEESNEKRMSFSTINVLFGTFYRSYGSVLARTFMIDPSKQQENDYNFTYEVFKHTFSSIEKGKTFGELYEACEKYIIEKRPDLLEFFVTNIGFLVGLESEPSNETMIKRGNKLVISDNMTIVLKVCFENVRDKSNKYKNDPKRNRYSLIIGNTILIPHGQVDPKFLTGGDVMFKKVAYSLEEDDEDVDMVDTSNILEGKTRRQKKQAGSMREEVNRRSRQREILEQKRNQGKVPVQQREDPLAKKEEFSYEKELSTGRKVAYNTHLNFPKVRKNKIYLDEKNRNILLPVGGQFAPFHISTLRNVSHSEENDYSYVRFNFKHPKAKAKKNYAPADDHPTSIFIKEMSYRSKDKFTTGQSVVKIKNLQKKVREHEKEINNRRKTVKQEKLIISRGTAIKLKDIHMRPNPGRGKTIGRLECHENGFRFVATRSKNVSNFEIIFSNIRNAFYQAAKKEIMVCIHFHLHNPIIVGKKLQKDIQFYTKVMEDNEQLTGRFRRSMSDRDAIIEERRERELRDRLNKEFWNFCKQVETKRGLKFEIPYNELEFSGTPFKQSSILKPTDSCLVCLTDTPFFVLNVEDVEVAVLERVQFGLRNFDLTFVPEHYNDVTQITTIPKDKIDLVRNWLTKVGVKIYEDRKNYQWGKVLNSIKKMGKDWDPWGNEGWSFVFGGDEEEEEDEEMEDGNEDMYKPPSDDESDSEEEELVEEPEEDEEMEDEEEPEDGKSWRQLAAEAKAYDKKRSRNFGYNDEFNDPRRKMRKF